MSEIVTLTCETIEWRAGQWIKLSRRMPRARFLEFLRLSGELEQLQTAAPQTVAEIAQYSTALSEAISGLYPILCAQIVAWNWTDLSDPDAETPPVLPKPTPEILDSLSLMDEVLWLVTALSETMFPSKN